MTTERDLSDDEVQFWLEALRSGSREEKIEARQNLSEICLSRGMTAEAIELLELNVRDQAANSATFSQLAGLYRLVGRDEDAAEAEQQASLWKFKAQVRVNPETGYLEVLGDEPDTTDNEAEVEEKRDRAVKRPLPAAFWKRAIANIMYHLNPAG